MLEWNKEMYNMHFAAYEQKPEDSKNVKVHLQKEANGHMMQFVSMKTRLFTISICIFHHRWLWCFTRPTDRWRARGRPATGDWGKFFFFLEPSTRRQGGIRSNFYFVPKNKQTKQKTIRTWPTSAVLPSKWMSKIKKKIIQDNRKSSPISQGQGVFFFVVAQTENTVWLKHVDRATLDYITTKVIFVVLWVHPDRCRMKADNGFRWKTAT